MLELGEARHHYIVKLQYCELQSTIISIIYGIKKNVTTHGTKNTDNGSLAVQQYCTCAVAKNEF
jgi:hypothetical protein